MNGFLAKFTCTCLFVLFILNGAAAQTTTALWLFDEPQGLYPSHVMDDQSENDYPLVIGPGGMIVEGLFGNALEAIPQPPVDLPEGEAEFGLTALPVPDGRTMEPLTWLNADFCAFMTSGERHLRKEVGFAQVTRTGLNLGNFWATTGASSGMEAASSSPNRS